MSDSKLTTHNSTLCTQNSALLVIDIQGRLAHMVHEKEKLFKNIQIMIQGCKVLGVPVIFTEQIPEKLGETVPEIKSLLTGIEPVKKTSFSCCGCSELVNKLKELGCNQLLLTGIESHICIYQSAIDLLDLGYEVHVVSDAVSSRTLENKQLALQKIRDHGGEITGTETALYELLKVAEGDKFKQILKLIK